MSELSKLIDRLKRGIAKNASYINTIRHPSLLVRSLQELSDLIGNDKVKDSVATQVSHLIMVKQRTLENPAVKEDDVMLNTVLYGPPGVGKTLVGAKLAKIWYSLGYLDSTNNSIEKRQEIADIIKDLVKGNSSSTTTDDNYALLYAFLIFIIVCFIFISFGYSFYSKFGLTGVVVIATIIIILLIILAYYTSVNYNSNTPTSNINVTADKAAIVNIPMFDNPSDDQIITIASRNDFVDKYVGWTDKKVIKFLTANLGKVVFVDEAYSLVTDMHDSFGIDALNTINLFLSQHPKEIIVIFAGYKDLMETGIFSVQPGLRRRFMWQFDCNGYNLDQMFDIFKLQLTKKGWSLSDETASKALFQEFPQAFPAFGGDTERLTFFSELEHSREYIDPDTHIEVNKLTPEHIRRGLAKLQENNIQSQPSTSSANPLANMLRMLQTGADSKNYQYN